jgi:putative ABC transport system permease protein
MTTWPWRRRRQPPDFDAEIDAHLAIEAERLQAEGLSPEEARAAALRAFGSVTRVRERFHDARPNIAVERLWLDLRYAVRTLRKTPIFALASIGTMALAIGATTAIFTVVNAVLLRPLPYPRADRLVAVVQSGAGGPEFATLPDYIDWRDQSASFSSLAGAWDRVYNLTGIEEPERLQGAAVTPNLFSTLAVQPVIGRGFDTRATDDPQTVVLSHSLWTRRFGATDAAIGRRVSLNGRVFTVIGVMPPGFAWPASAELWVPLVSEPGMTRGYHLLHVVGRLKDHTTLATARAELETIASAAATAYPATNKNWGVYATTLLDHTVQSSSRALLMLSGAVVCVLLIACANVAGLLTARSASRSLEISIRAALGATRGRIVRQLLIESLVLAIASGAVGLWLATVTIDPLVSLTPLPRAREISLDPTVVVFALLTSLVTGVLFGLAPAVTSSRVDLQRALTVRGTGSMGRMRPFLLATEIAAAVILLAGAGLLMRSFHRLQNVDAGFAADRLLTTRFFLPRASYPVERCVRLYQDMIERVQRLPNVERAAAVSAFPLSGTSPNVVFQIPEQRRANDQIITAEFAAVTPGYFRMMGIPIVAGRDVEHADRPDSPFVAIVNRAMADQFFPAADPIGRFITILGPQPRMIVGVAENIRHRTLLNVPEPAIYVPHTQFPTGGMFLVIRSRSADPASLAPAVRAELRALDPDLPLAAMRTAESLLDDALSSRRFSLLLLSIFAATALLLSIVGVYAVVAFSVSLRMKEIGIRVALGAARNNVVWLIIRQGMVPVTIGLAAGLLGALATTRVLSNMLFEIRPSDPMTLVGVSLVLLLSAVAAVVIPARRAAHVDPISVLQ